jgi:hypothetical protein
LLINSEILVTPHELQLTSQQRAEVRMHVAALEYQLELTAHQQANLMGAGIEFELVHQPTDLWVENAILNHFQRQGWRCQHQYRTKSFRFSAPDLML